MATIYEVSKLAGVSLATVSRVMNKNARVSDKTKEKVLSAMEALDYRPNSIAQSLASSRTNSVGVLVSEFEGPFYGSMMQGIETELRTAEKHVIIAAGHSEEAKEIDGIEFLISKKCDALILHVEAVSDEYLVKLAQGDTPVLLVNRYIHSIADRCISLDNELGGYLATKYILDQGHQNIAYISGPLWKSDAKNRFNGHKKALAERGLDFSLQLLFEGDYHEECGSRGLRYFMQQKLNFTAVVCGNDVMASGVINHARDNGLSVPEDLSIMGFDNVIFASYIYPRLSTINYPIYDMGQMAARWVLKNTYKKDKLIVESVFKPELITRNSVQPIK